MNTPNKLTVLRMAMIPVFLVFMLIDTIPLHYIWALAVFAAASFTDFLDGYLARRDNLVTDFGKFMDPLADKLLVTSALICFVELRWTPALVVIIILAREFLVTSVRLIAAGSGKVIAADIWGKLKTVFQIVWVCYALLIWGLGWQENVLCYGLFVVLMVIVVVLTVFSGGNYVWKNRSFLLDSK
ncbi:CDP-diacylglycerol--glycerol-3-phosphate 3-phosphatidyltransferase [Youxingia wuxianensis]|uniref:CDP-diacylglycerol--glycerol-3-phosphate 3-phosphatidyltransferase n=1 Tax=Youxingia wuxianensis TaxID=2763678 RepID=A0A926IGZ1_9FIRM|nr:CDP-diacylglycerol--glycerol-3-phosphate 3-phosphatidyltransferase [Youxingia wuxianensis]MBC8584595.1 CDP-diacylglycerol--glycerol-3-phosphate 3-phosphatidyltransferase [Youxingia wuxianensis]